jgi:hypothetical protein
MLAPNKNGVFIVFLRPKIGPGDGDDQVFE